MLDRARFVKKKVKYLLHNLTSRKKNAIKTNGDQKVKILTSISEYQ